MMGGKAAGDTAAFQRAWILDTSCGPWASDPRGFLAHRHAGYVRNARDGPCAISLHKTRHAAGGAPSA